MNKYILIAGILCFLLGIAHSIIGEYLIFKGKRVKGKIVPTKINVDLKERHLRIIWATWHLLSIFGWCIGAILIKISITQNQLNTSVTEFIVQSVIYTMFLSSFIVLFGTKGKHPAWIVFLIIGILLISGS